MTAPASTSDQTFHNLAAEFLRLLRTGECRSVKEFADRYPEKSELIQREFAGIHLAEALAPLSNVRKAPKTVGRYVIENEIGRGGMGVVYAARHPTLGTELAVKIVPLSRIQGGNAEVRFESEARACASMDHPHIVPVFDYGITEEFAFFAMRRIRGCSLEKVIRHAGDNEFRTLRWHQIATIGRQAADALHYSHELGIIHRDIKPANMILDHREKIWVTDFGLAKAYEQEDSNITKTGQVVGTPRYMAPERLQGISAPTTDVFGLGLTLYELVSGHRVWDNLEDHHLTSKGAALTLPALNEVCPEVPEQLSNIIMKACAFQPDDRFQTAAELRFVLDRILDGKQLGDRRRKKNNARSRWHRKDVLYASAAIVTLFCVFAFSWIRSLQSERQVTPQEIVEVFEEDEDAAVEALPKVAAKLFLSEEKSGRAKVTKIIDDFLPVVLDDLGLENEERKDLISDYEVWRESYRQKSE